MMLRTRRLRWRLRSALAALLLVGMGARPAAAAYYRIDQTYGDIAFTVHHLGLFSSTGEFRHFTGHIVIDEQHPAQCQVAVTIDAGSIEMPWGDAVTMLRSSDFFDVSEYPTAGFVSTAVMAVGPSQYDVSGILTIRGVSRPVHLRAALVGRHQAPDRHSDIADFVVSGTLDRSAFGMVTDRTFISDRVMLLIHARVRLEDTAGGGPG